MKLLGIFVKAGQNLPNILRLITILVGSLLSAAVFTLALGVLVLTQKELSLPGWASQTIVRQIDNSLEGLKFKNSDLSVSLDSQWRPMLTFGSSVLSDFDGQTFLRLRHLDATFSLRQAILGQIEITDLTLDGLIVSVFKNKDSSVVAQFGGIEPNDAGVILPADLKLQVDQFFMQPSLAAFNTFEIQNITLNYIDRIANRNWTIDGANFHLKKSNDELTARADLALLAGGADVALLEANLEAEIGQKEATFGLKFSDLPSNILATQSSAFVWLSALKAPISGALRGSLDASGEIGPLNATFNIANGFLQPNVNSSPLGFDMLRTYLTYEPKSQVLNFDSISLESPDISLTAEGKAFIQTDEDQAVSLVGQFILNEIKANPQNAYEIPISLDLVTVDFQLFVDPFKIHLKQLYAHDKVRDINARMSAVVSTDPNGWTVSMDSEVDQISSESLLAFWPDFFKPKLREWLNDNILKADFSQVMFSFIYDGQNHIRSNTKLVFNDMTFRALSEFPLIEKANGVYTNHDHRLVASFKNAVVASESDEVVNLAGSRFTILDTKTKPNLAQLSIVGKGRLRTVLELLNTAPLYILDRADERTDIADGNATIQADVFFPIKSGLTANDVSTSATGEVLDFTTRNLFGEQSFSGKRATLDLTPDTLVFYGVTNFKDLNLDTEVKFDFDTGISSLVANLEIDRKLIDSFSIPIPREVFSGRAPASLKVIFPRNEKASFSLESDLLGAVLRLDQFEWKKSQNTVVDLSVDGYFENGLVVDNFSVTGAGLQLLGERQTFENSGPYGFKFEKFAIGDNIDIAGSVRPDGSFEVKRGYFDARPYLLSSKRSKIPSQKQISLKVALDSVQVTNKLSLRNFVGDLDIGQALIGEFSSNFGPRAKVKGLLKPAFDQTQVELRSQQAGAVLTEFGAVKNAVGGELLLTLTPAKTDRATDGYLKVDNVKIQGVPILAELLNAISIVGLIDLLSGPGISFTEIESKFRITKDQLIVKSASAFGPAMGVTLDGYYDLRNKTFDMQGTISPVYLINGVVGSVFSKKGEGLLGFNFLLKGKADNFDLKVNPLSVFTPAIFRDIFRRPPPVYEE